MGDRRARSAEAVARALVRALDDFTERFDDEIVETDADHLHAVRRLADDFSRPTGVVGETGP